MNANRGSIRDRCDVKSMRWLSAGVFLATVACPHCASAHEGHAALPSKGLTVAGNELLLSEGARKAIDLTTAKVTLAHLARTVDCNARIELPWSQQAQVTTQVPGRVTAMLVRPGDIVHAGQELARVESLELESLQLAMLQADAQSAFANDQFQRRSSLASQGVIAGRDLAETEALRRQRTAELEVSLCKLRGLGLDQKVLDQVRTSHEPLSSAAIVAPIFGTVADADIRVGQQVKTTQHLFHVVDLSRLWAIGSVLESDIALVRKGQPVIVTFKSLPKESFTATITELRLKMDEIHRMRDVVVSLDRPNELLRPGMFGRMAIQVAESREAVVAPVEAIISDRGGQYVLLNRGEGKYIRQTVKVGIRAGKQMEILDGLFPGDQVVVKGNHVLFSLLGGAQKNAVAQATVGSWENGATQTVRREADREPIQTNHTIVVQGVVELPTDRKVYVGARIEGCVGRILVERSQPVEAGQVLAEIESLELRDLQGELLETDVKLAWTSQRVRHLSELAQQNIPSRKELWQLETDERVLTAKRASLLRKLAMIGISEGEIARLLATDLSSPDCDLNLVCSVPIRTPIAGAVADFSVVPGQVVDVQSSLFEIHDGSKVWVKGYVFQQDAMRVGIGQPVRVTFVAEPAVALHGKVVRLAPVMESSERVLPLWVEVDNPDGRLIDGMWAQMEIEVGTTPVPTKSDAPRTSSATRVIPVTRIR